MMLFRRAVAAVLGCILTCCATPVFASEVPDPGATFTVPLSAAEILPAEYNGDVRALPPILVPSYFHLWNEFEGPPSAKPPPQAPSGPTPPDTNVALAAMPAPIANFAGLHLNQTFSGSQVGAGFPPDTNGDVGLDYYIQSVNDAWGIYSKSTGALVAGFTENQLWAGAGTGTPCDANNFGDPVVLFDAQVDRWILTNFAFAVSGGNPVAPFYQCIAVSKTSDPVAGGWYLYAVRMDTGTSGAPPTGTLNDYGKFGLWTDCLYMGANGFLAPNFSFNGAIFASFDRATLYSGAALNSTNSSLGFISGSTAPFTLIPANLLGTQAASLPPAGTPEYFVAESNSVFAFEVRKFQHGATACGSGSSLSSGTNVSQTSYSVPASNIVPQPGTTNTLDSLGERLMSKVQYRKVGSAESLWVVHSTQASSSSTVRPQWAQINVSGGTIATTPVQQQIYAPDTTVYRWMGSIAADQNGNMAIGYSKASGSVFPGIAYAGRLVGDATGTLPQTETSLIDGNGSQTNNCGGAPCHRWGDYASMSIDPLDDCTFWFTSEYYDTQTNGTIGNWQTRIGSFKFSGCGVAKLDQTISFTSSAPGAATFGGTPYVVTATATSGLAVTLTIDATATSVCSLSGSSVSFIGVGTCKINANQAGDGSYNAAPQVQQSFSVSKATQTINFTSSAPAGAKVAGTPYVVTATATSGLAVTLTIDATTTSVCSLSGSSSGSSVSFLTVGTCKVNASQPGNTNYNAATQAQQSFAVGKGDQTVNFTSSAPAGAKVAGTAYVVTATATSGLAVTLTIDATTTSVCSLSGSTSGSSVSFLAVGTCKVNASQAGNTNYNAATPAQQSFAVSKGDQTISFTSSAPAGAKVAGSAYVVTAAATSGLAVTLTIDATTTSVCSLTGSSVSFLSVGTCKINANQAGDSNYNAASQVQQSFAVGKGDQTVSFTSSVPASAKVGGTAYVVTATATSGLAVTLAIDATTTSVCSLSGSTSGSSVSFLTVGTCKVNANQAGNANYNAATPVQQSFAVGKGDQTVGFTSSAPAGAKVAGTAYVVTATATSGLAVTLTIDATTTSVCSLSGSTSGSSVSFLAVGTCKVNASQSGDTNYNAATQAQQTFAVGKGDQTVGFTSTAPVNATFGGAAYIVTATATSGLAVTLSIDPASASVCALNGSTSGSSVSFTGTGTCTIDANQPGSASYNSAPQVQQSFTVGKADQTVGFTSTAPAAATVGGAAYVVTATATSGLAVNLSIHSNATAVCQLSGSASGSQVTFIGVGNCRIDVSQPGDANFNAAAQDQQTFAVGKGAQTISFDSTAPIGAAVGGATYQVLATATSGLAVSLAIDAASATVCQLDGSSSGSNVSFIGVGTCTIDATQAGDVDYAAAPPQQQSFGVVPGPATQLVFTVQPAAVTAGGSLGAIAVTVKDAFGNVIDDNGSPVTFSVTACSGAIELGSAMTVHGVATLLSPQRFYTVTSPATLKVSAASGALGAESTGFAVVANGDLAFADGFESCRL